jgi:hypothetical protein
MSQVYNNRFRRQLVQQVKCLSETEHEEVFKIMHMNGIEYTKNKNGFFFNISLVDDSVIKLIHEFVSFSLENKKHLDEYDKKMNECKINNNYTEFMQTSSVPLENIDHIIDHRKDDWSKLIDPYKDKLNSMFDSINDNIVKAAKRKCNTKFNLAKKKYSKRITSDKKIDIEQESTLTAESYVHI